MCLAEPGRGDMCARRLPADTGTHCCGCKIAIPRFQMRQRKVRKHFIDVCMCMCGQVDGGCYVYSRTSAYTSHQSYSTLRHRRNLCLPLPTSSAVLTGKKLRAQLLTADEDIPPPITGAAPPSFQSLLTGLNQRGLCEEGGSTGSYMVIVAQWIIHRDERAVCAACRCICVSYV